MDRTAIFVCIVAIIYIAYLAWTLRPKGTMTLRELLKRIRRGERWVPAEPDPMKEQHMDQTPFWPAP